HPNGGFGHLSNQQPQAQFTYNAIVLLKELGVLNKIDKNKHINWLKLLQTPDGGFSHIPGQSSHITHTYFAVKALIELESLNQINKDKLIQFILSCEHPNGGFGHLSNQQPQAQFTYNAIVLLKELKTYFIELYDRCIQELEKISDPAKIDELVNNIISAQVLDDKLVNTIKKEVENLKNITKNNLLEKILNMIPNFVYFDSIDFIGDSIPLDEYLKNTEKYKTFTNLFKLAGLDVKKIRATRTPHTISRLFKSATAKITGMINEFWEQEEVTVNLEMIGDKILVSIDDALGAKADPPSKRSDGFRWFLSFYINFMAGTKGELKNTVLLLDNPGWVLHPSGQKDLLKALEEIAKTNQIIIATHSPFLIDKNKLERIRIVERKEDEGTKVYEKFWDSLYDSLQVIRASIGADISDSLFGHKNNIIVEGFSDKVYLEAMNNYLKRKDKKTIGIDKVMIIGAGGADKVPYLVAWLKAERYNSLALLDADNEGRRVIQEIENRNIEIDKDLDVLMLNEISEEFKGKDIEIEDLFDEKFYNMAVNKAYREVFESKLKKLEIKLEEIPTNGLKTKRYYKFFKNNNLGGFDKVKVALEIKRIIKEREEVAEETISNFEKLFEKIKEKFKKKGIEL
ncbi:MAG: AAA family ATPase, partial [Candidatus Desulfofervidus auxilii]|nr:AAA family ATPase [Candidatus Desulfofervidus auxilii]